MTRRSNDGTPRPCRAFRARTSEYVRLATREWAYVFGHPTPTVDLDVSSCLLMANSVKGLLSRCPSVAVEEVLAWQSIKKALPSSCKCMDAPLLEGVVSGFRSGRVVVPQGYLAFVRKETRRLFYRGWSRKYWEKNVLGCSPGLSSTVDSPRAHGGMCNDWKLSHERFLSTCLHSQPPYEPLDSDLACELMVVQSAGKPRPLTKFTSESLLLKPLHDSIYDRLRSLRWLSVGDVSDSTLKRAGFRRTDDEVLTSGDYKSATDGLSIEVAEVILSEILLASEVPEHLRSFAMKALRPLIYGDGVDGVRPKRGQMMGSFLSFPLLCLQNRFAFLWAFRWLPDNGRSLPCLINGDDILFQSGPRASDRWMASVGDLGLEVERTKTSVDAEVGTLNSTLLRFVGVDLRVIQTLRWGRLKPQELPHSLAANFTSWLAGSNPACRFRAGMVFFRRYVGLLRSTRLTLLELGFRGKLAYRLARMFKMASGECSVVLPHVTVGHNAVPAALCTVVPEEEVESCLIEANDRETAAWKFSFRYSQWFELARIRDCVRLSSVRSEPVPQFSVVEYDRCPGLRWKLTPPSWSSVLRSFLVPVRETVKVRLIFDSLLVARDHGPPPPYVADVGPGLGSPLPCGGVSEKKGGVGGSLWHPSECKTKLVRQDSLGR